MYLKNKNKTGFISNELYKPNVIFGDLLTVAFLESYANFCATYTDLKNYLL